MMFPQGGKPVLDTPAGRVSGVDDHDRQVGVRGHLCKPVPETAGRDVGDEAAVPAPAPAARGPVPGLLASFGAGLGEVKVLDRQRPRPGCFRGRDEARHGGPDAAVAGGGGQPGERERDGERHPGHVAVRGDDGDREVPVIHVHGYDRRCPQLV